MAQRRHQQLTAWRCPPEQPMRSGEAVFQPDPRVARRSRYKGAFGLFTAPDGRGGCRALGQGHIFLDGQVFAGAGHRVLKHARHLLGAAPWGMRVTSAVDGDAPGVRAQVAGMAFKGGFAGAVGADDGDELAGGDLSDMPRSARVSIGVPGLKVMKGLVRSARWWFLLGGITRRGAELALRLGTHQRHGNGHGGDQVQVLRLQADEVAVQRQRDERRYRWPRRPRAAWPR